MHAPISQLVTGPLLKTPQGWVGTGAAIAYTGAARFFSLTETIPPFGWTREKTSTFFAIWPVLLFMYFIKDNSADFSPSWKAASWQGLIAMLALLVGWWRATSLA